MQQSSTSPLFSLSQQLVLDADDVCCVDESLPFLENSNFSSSIPLGTHELVARIEVLTLEFLSSLVLGTVPLPFTMVSLSCQLSSLSRRRSFKDSRLIDLLKPSKRRSNMLFSNQEAIRLGKLLSTRDFFRNPVGYCRVWSVLNFIHRLHRLKRIASQRSLYYHLINLFDNQEQSNNVLMDVTRLLECPRLSLRIFADERGSIIGRISLKTHDGKWINCDNQGSNGRRISQIENYIDAKSDAKCILVIEKDAVFQRLAEDRFYATYPSILITARGVPDLASRSLLRFLQNRLRIPIYALVDYNPGGLEVFLTYRTGSLRAGIEGFEYTVKVFLLGLLASDITSLPRHVGVPFNVREKQKLKGLLQHPLIQKHQSLQEHVQQMIEGGGLKYEIEAVYGDGFAQLKRFVTQKLLHKKYLQA